MHRADPKSEESVIGSVFTIALLGWHKKLHCYSENLNGQTRKRVGHTSVYRGSKRFYFGYSSFSPGLREESDKKKLFTPAGQAKVLYGEKLFLAQFFSRASSARANSPNWACKPVCASRASRCFVGKKSPLHLLEITIFYCFDS